MTSGNLQKAMGVASAATANAWADEYSKMSMKPVLRNQKGAREFDSIQIEIIVEAFRLHRENAGLTRYNALKKSIEDRQLMRRKKTEFYDPDAVESTNDLIEMAGLPGEAEKPSFNDLPTTNSFNLTEEEIEEYLKSFGPDEENYKTEAIVTDFKSDSSVDFKSDSSNENYAAMATKLDQSPVKNVKSGLGLFFGIKNLFISMIQLVVYIVRKAYKFTKSCFLVRENPMWIMLSPLQKRIIVEGAFICKCVVCLMIGIAALLCTTGYLVSQAMILFGQTPVFIPWDRFAVGIAYSFAAAFALYLIFPNDL
jgi:hypothetical protein